MKIFENRNDMVNKLVIQGGVYGEIGVFKGEFSKFLLGLNPSKLVLFDLFDGICESGDVDGNGVCNTNMAHEYYNLNNIDNVLELIKGDSSTELLKFNDGYFDMLYIDGDHSYEGCKKDLNVALKKVKKGGWVMGHDYEMNMKKAKTYYSFGVKQAVDEICKENNLTIYSKAMDGCVSYCILNV
jgi:hypothetical protein